MAGSTEKLLGYRVKMLPDTNAVNSEIKKMKIEKRCKLVVIQYDISNTIKLRIVQDTNESNSSHFGKSKKKKRLLNTSK